MPITTNDHLLANLRVVLVQTYHPGNIGAAARAMRTMGITALHLINPRDFPAEEASRMAAGASELLKRAQVHDSLQAAVGDCTMVIGASARLRERALPCFEEGDEMGQAAMHAALHGPVALVFGRERFGLTNEELDHCTHQLRLPTDPSYGILNLAQAVQIACYELRNAWRRGNGDRDPERMEEMQGGEPRPSRAQLQYFDELLVELLRPTGFLNQPHAKTQEKLRAIIRRSEPSKRELSMLTGMIKALAGK